ncbi:hypothetical protein SKAU_G00023330 [Synaphobranchus kaupii]|uniref:Uncharacterized protein n=1 Tax=Synaphobranchus kaupii TaxID=118154 RepID=A0A9Q1JE40_SYNKA|nr:hypothetical protein SKAU_G00023330 [Synaphobranchus kaupii]
MDSLPWVFFQLRHSPAAIAVTRRQKQRHPNSHWARECHPLWQDCREELRASLDDGNRKRRGQTGKLGSSVNTDLGARGR